MNCHVFEGEKPFWIFHNIASDMKIQVKDSSNRAFPLCEITEG